MPVVITPASQVSLFGFEFSFDQQPIVNTQVYVRQLVGGVATGVGYGGPGLILTTDKNGRWSSDAIPSINLVPQSIIEVNSPTLGIFRLKIPGVNGDYEAIFLRDDSL